jgi:hypothetical protein
LYRFSYRSETRIDTTIALPLYATLSSETPWPLMQMYRSVMFDIVVGWYTTYDIDNSLDLKRRSRRKENTRRLYRII